MKISRRSSLSTIALAVGDALRRHDIRAVLTGGACASVYTAGTYHSVDVDFVLSGQISRSRLDSAMGSIGFVRQGDYYVHPSVLFYVEFPKGPLAVGGDVGIRPVQRKTKGAMTWMLSATDSCRDRLAAFYHWNDRQSLRVAVSIACRNRVLMASIRDWSEREGATGRFEEFRREVRAARRRRRSRRA